MTTLPAEARADLRERIIDMATRLFADQGFAATSVRQLVESCKCTKPALYYYFENKESLYLEVVQRHIEDHNRMIRDWTSSQEPVRQSCHHAMASFIDYAEAKPEVMRLLQRVEMQPEEGAPEFNIMATRELHLQMIGELLQRGIASGQLREGLDPEDCALVMAGAMSFQCELSVAQGVWDRERIHRTLDLIFDGIAR